MSVKFGSLHRWRQTRWHWVLAALILLLFGCYLWSASTAQAATTITVNTLDDELNNDGDCSLYEAIEAANSDSARDACPAGNGADTINFSVTGIISIFDPLPFIPQDLTIIGPGADKLAISANDVVEIFEIEAGVRVTMSKLTIADGYSSRGSVIYNLGQLTLNDCVIDSSRTILSGAIFNTAGAFMSIDRCTILNNRAPTGGGAILNEGVLNIYNSTFSGNIADSLGGSAILNKSVLTLYNSVFRNNSAVGDGGAIYNEGHLTVSESTFEGNSATDEGGVIYLVSGVLNSMNNTFEGNSASEGGAIYVVGAAVDSVNLTNNTFAGNKASYLGGALVDTEDSSSYVSPITIKNSTFVDNVATSNYTYRANSIFSYEGPTLSNTIIASSAPGDNCHRYGNVIDGGHNLEAGDSCSFLAVNGSLINTDPKLKPLANNGGATKTAALKASSPAVDAGNDTICADLATVRLRDQRGIPRPQRTACDIGAYEFNPPTYVGVIADTQGCSADAESILFVMDDEDDAGNTSDLTGWVGATTQNAKEFVGYVATYTKLEFCKVDGSRFFNWYSGNQDGQHGYAVLKLDDYCPNGSQEFSRIFDNQDSVKNGSANANFTIGNIYPHFDSVNMKLNFCFFPGSFTPSPDTMTSFPDFPFTYGVFANRDFLGAKVTGTIYMDDEDDDNGDTITFPPAVTPAVQTAMLKTVYGYPNTTMEVAKVHDYTYLGLFDQEHPRVVDVTISLERVPTAAEKIKYTQIISHFADTVYEMSNGVHQIGKVTFYTNQVRWTTADVQWAKTRSIIQTTKIKISDEPVRTVRVEMADIDQRKHRCEGKPIEQNFLKAGNVCDEVGPNFDTVSWQELGGRVLAHEWGHYFYKLRDEYAKQSGDVAIVSVMGGSSASANLADTGLEFSSKDPLWNESNDQYREWGASAWTVLGRSREQDFRIVNSGPVDPDMDSDWECLGKTILQQKCDHEADLRTRPVKVSVKIDRQELPELYTVNPLPDSVYTRQIRSEADRTKARSALNIIFCDDEDRCLPEQMQLTLVSDEYASELSSMTQPFHVNPGSTAVKVQLSYDDRPNKQIQLTINDPNGQSRATVTCPFTGKKEAECSAVVQNPTPGDWTFVVGTTAPPIDVHATVIAETNDTISSYQAGVGAQYGNVIPYPYPVIVIATMQQTRPIAKANLIVKASGPDGKPLPLLLKDDGVAPDALADDGHYTGYLDYTQSGPHHIAVTFDNRAGGAEFTAVGLAHPESPYPVGENFQSTAQTVIYVLNVKPDDHGNTPATATSLDPDNLDLPGKIDYAGDVDVFKVVVSETAPLAVRMDGMSLDMLPKFKVLGSDGATVIKEKLLAPGATTYPFVVIDAHAGEVYFIQVAQQDANATRGWYYVSAGKVLSSGGEDRPLLTVDQRQLNFSATAGASNPAVQSLKISNPSSGVLNWTASTPTAWLSLSPTNGVAPATVNVTANINGLAAGTYPGEIQLSAGEQTVTIPVTLVVQGGNNGPDSDGDSIPDSVEGSGDFDGDGKPNKQDEDSDNDTISDRTEGSGDADRDGQLNFVDTDADGDGIADQTEGAGDSDGDGVPNFLDRGVGSVYLPIIFGG